MKCDDEYLSFKVHASEPLSTESEAGAGAGAGLPLCPGALRATTGAGHHLPGGAGGGEHLLGGTWPLTGEGGAGGEEQEEGEQEQHADEGLDGAGSRLGPTGDGSDA